LYAAEVSDLFEVYTGECTHHRAQFAIRSHFSNGQLYIKAETIQYTLIGTRTVPVLPPAESL